MTFSRRALLTLSTVLIAASIGAVGIEAAPLCRTLVREYREKQVRNSVSKETAARWAKWNKTHPNFHPHSRPKYKMVPEEVVRAVDFDCRVPAKPAELSVDIAPIIPDFTLGPDSPSAPAIVISPPVLPTMVEVATATTPAPPFLPPYSPALSTPNLSPVPEPSSLVLMTTGVALLGVCIFFKRRSVSEL